MDNATLDFKCSPGRAPEELLDFAAFWDTKPVCGNPPCTGFGRRFTGSSPHVRNAPRLQGARELEVFIMCSQRSSFIHRSNACPLGELLAAGAITLGLSHGSAIAQPVDLPIVNPGFEELNVTLRPGEQTNGAGGVPGGSGLLESPVNTRWGYPFQPGTSQPQTGVIVPGWRTTPGATGSLAGVLNPDVMFSSGGGQSPWMTGYTGNHVATAQAAVMQQTLNVLLQPETTYTVSFTAGIGTTDLSYHPVVQLLAAPDLTTFARAGSSGVTLLAQMPFVQIDRPQFGMMLPFSFSYTTPATLPNTLSNAYIVVSFLGSDGVPRVNFDDFRVSAVPGPGSGGAVALAGLALLRRKRVARTANCA